ncbi:MAG: hypothetical protein C0506_08060 [Anaerolinea sp.]|nr:hypothetical protein [Anaerolinea sp.]
MTTAGPLIDLYGCGWTTVSLGADEMASIQARMAASHPGRPIIASCQRLEAFGDTACDCPAPGKWAGVAALERIAQVAAGLHSAVLGEEQIMGQVRAGFADASPAVRRLADVAIAAARELRRATPFESHAGHLLDRGLRLAGLPAAGTLLVLGTGAMGRLVAARGLELGFDRVLIAGRQRPADDEEQAWEFVPLAGIAQLSSVTVIAGCLGSGAGELAPGDLPTATLALDLGTPRNFAVGERILTMADLLREEHSRAHSMHRRAELQAKLSQIVARHLERANESGASLVGSLRLEVERVRQRELGRMQRLHPELPPQLLETLTRSLVDQIFHRPSARLRQRGDAEFGRDVVALFAED